MSAIGRRVEDGNAPESSSGRIGRSAQFQPKSMRPQKGYRQFPMSNPSVPNLEERLKHASEARKSMLEKFKMSLVETPAVIEKRQQRQAIIAAKAARDVEREEARLRKERDQVKQAELEAKALADAARAAAELAARDAGEKGTKGACRSGTESGSRCALRGAEGSQEATATGLLAHLRSRPCAFLLLGWDAT
jgi:hypothetical protein